MGGWIYYIGIPLLVILIIVWIVIRKKQAR